MKKTIILTLLSLMNLITVFGQDAMVYNETKPESELHAAINPLDTNNIIVAAINGFSQGNAPGNLSVYYTIDFGNSWQKSSFHGIPANHVGAGDPVLRFDNSGNAYLVNLSSDISSGAPIIHTVISYSTDKGATWQSIISNNGETDKPWLSVDNNPTSPYAGYKYIPTVELIGNDNKIILTVLNNTNSVVTNSVNIFPDLTSPHLPCTEINSNGDVFISAHNNNTQSLVIARSTDGGMSFGTYSTITTIQLDNDTDHIIGISDRMQCSPYMAIDKSGGSYNNRIYMTYTDLESGSTGGSNTILDTYLTWSDNDGTSWTAPKTIHSGATSNTQQYYSNIYVNNDGELLLGWYDRRDDLTHKMADYYIGISTDGGNTIKEVKVSSSASDFSNIGTQNEGFGIGEYCQLVATDNIAVPFWADGRTNDGDINIYFTKIDINNPTAAIHEISSISDKINLSVYPIPIIDNATVNVTLKQDSKLKWTLFDINGKEISSSNLKHYTEGKTKIEMPLKALQSGIYFIQFTSDNNFIKTVKIIKQ